MRQHRLRNIRLSNHGGAPGAKDARLFETDRLARAAEVIHVVNADGGDDRYVGIDDVDGIQAATEPDFQHQDVRRMPCKRREGRQGANSK